MGFLSLVACDKERSTPILGDDNYTPKYTSDELLKKFNAEYKNGINPTMSPLFVEWNSLIAPNGGQSTTHNDTTNALYAIFKIVYQPHHLSKLGDWEWDKLNSNEKYVVVQNKLFYSVVDVIENPLEPRGNKLDSIVNFRPIVSLEAGKVLYLTSEYRTAINKFLGSDYLPLGTGGVMNPAMPTGESQKRAEALSKYITILHGHWGNYWYLETHPEISQIVLNKSLNRAKVFYRVGYMGGETSLIKQGKQWLMTESKSTWIE